MQLSTQFIVVFFLGLFVGLTIIAFIQRIIIGVWVKFTSTESTEKIGKSFQEKLEEKIKEARK